MIRPGTACASIEEHRNEEQVKQSPGDFLVVRGVGRRSPLIDQRLNPRSASVEMPPSTMGWDLVRIRE